MVEKDCFAYKDASYWFEDEYLVKNEVCKILEEMICRRKKCPFYKKKGTEKEVIFHAQGVKDAD